MKALPRLHSGARQGFLSRMHRIAREAQESTRRDWFCNRNPARSARRQKGSCRTKMRHHSNISIVLLWLPIISVESNAQEPVPSDPVPHGTWLKITMDDHLNMPYRLRMPTDVCENRWPHLPRTPCFNLISTYPSLICCLRLSHNVAGRHVTPCGADR